MVKSFIYQVHSIFQPYPHELGWNEAVSATTWNETGAMNRQFVWSHGEPPMVKSWCVSRPGGSLVAWHMALICLPQHRKRNLGHVSSIYEACSYSITHNECLCAYLYQWKQNSLPGALSFYNFYTQLLKSGMKNSGKISKHNQPGRKFDLYSLGDGQWLEQFIWKFILKLEKFQYHLWHRFMSTPHFEKGTKLYSFRCKK